jgi:hypothetical protein
VISEQFCFATIEKWEIEKMATIDFMKPLGWQGGTIYQALSEVQRLREIEDRIVHILAARIPDGYGSICRCCGGRTCSDNCVSTLLTESAKDKLRNMRMAIED